MTITHDVTDGQQIHNDTRIALCYAGDTGKEQDVSLSYP